MGNVVKRNDPNKFQVNLSVNTPDFPNVDWAWNPPLLTSLIGTGTKDVPQVPKKYWIIDPPSSNALREMTSAEKAVVDAAEIDQVKADRKALLQQDTDSYVSGRYPQDVQLQILSLQPTASDIQNAGIQQYLAWYRSVHDGLNAALSQIDDATTSAEVSAVTFDPGTFTASDPLFQLQSA